MIHSILMSEVKGMGSQILRALGKTRNKKEFEVSSCIQFQQFSRKEIWKGFRLIAITFSPLELKLLDFDSISLMN